MHVGYSAYIFAIFYEIRKLKIQCAMFETLEESFTIAGSIGFVSR